MSILSAVLGATKSVIRRFGLMPHARRFATTVFAGAARLPLARSAVYRARVAMEKAYYANVANVHDLPAIYHYWSHRYLLPKMLQFGFSGVDDFFANQFERCLAPGLTSRFISIGSGNCDTEVRVAALLRSRGKTDFVIECLEINPDMLSRGEAHAAQHGMQAQIALVEGDFNSWKPRQEYHAIMANQSLHHVLELEHVFGSVKAALGARGRFIASDMIGRNGHQRWPEALEIVREFWRSLPPKYRYNRQLARQEDEFLDWDCSISGFEGVRVQDILPLLVDRFEFEEFLAFANVIDPFIDRSFGPNFAAEDAWDRAFIDKVHARDEEELASGRIKPTHMFAVMSAQPPGPSRFLCGLSPERCVRRP